jgi:hypothetical protein
MVFLLFFNGQTTKRICRFKNCKILQTK